MAVSHSKRDVRSDKARSSPCRACPARPPMPSWETHHLGRGPCLHLPYQPTSTARFCKASNRHAKIKILAPAHPPLTPAFKATASSSPFLLFHINISLENFSFQHLKHPLSNNSIEFISQPPAPRPVSLRLTLTRDLSPSFVPLSHINYHLDP